MIRPIAATAIVHLCVSLIVSAQLTVNNPSGGETLTPGSSYLIRWTDAVPGALYDLDYSRNGGSTWLPVSRGVSGTSYLWVPIPADNSTSCRIRVIRKATAANSGVVRLVDPAGLADGPGYSPSWSPDGQRVVTGSDSGYVTVYDAFTGTKLLQARINSVDVPTQNVLRVHRVQYDPTGSWIACYTNDDSLAILDATSLQVLTRWHTGISSIPNQANTRGMDIHPSQPWIAISNVGGAKIFDRTGVQLAAFVVFGGNSHPFIQWHPDGERLVVSGFPQGIAVLEASTQAIQRVRNDGEMYGCFRISPDGSRLAAVSGTLLQPSRKWTLFDVSNLNPVDSFLPTTSFGSAAHDYLSDGRIVIGRSPSGSTSIVERRSGADLSLLDSIGREYTASDLQASPNPDYIVLESYTGATVIGPARAGAPADTAISALFSIVASAPSDSLLRLAIDTVRTTTNQRISPALRMLSRSDSALGSATTIQVVVSWDASMAAPAGSTPVGTIAGGRRTITLDVPTTPVNGTVLDEIELHTALGLRNVTDLRIDQVLGLADPTRLVTTNGLLELTDICVEGGSRYVNGDGTLSVVARPNPAYGGLVQIDVSTIEQGVHRLTVVNALGQVVHEVALECRVPIVPGTQTYSINANLLEQGAYCLRLESPTTIYRTMLLVAQ